MYTEKQYQSPSIQQQKYTIQKLLDDNSQLISFILDLQLKGKQNEVFEYQRMLYRNLVYLTQFDPSHSHHSNQIPAPDAFIQPQPSYTNEHLVQQTQSDQIHRAQANIPIMFDTQNQILHQFNNSSHALSASTNSSAEQQSSPVSPRTNPIMKPTIFQPRLSHSQQGRALNSTLMDPAYSQSFISPEQPQLYSMQHGDYMQQHPIYHPQRNKPVQSNASIIHSSINAQNFVSNQSIMYNNYDEQQQQMYYSTQNYQVPQQWPEQSRMPIQQQQEYVSSYQQQVPPHS